MEKFNIVVMPLTDGGWLVSCPTLSTTGGTGETIFEAIADWQNRIVVDAANAFVKSKMNRE